MFKDIRKKIQECIDGGQKDIVIAPFGYWGGQAKKILNGEYGIKELFCVDNDRYDMKGIFPAAQMPRSDKRYTVLIATANAYYRYQLEASLRRYMDADRIKVCVGFPDQQKAIFDDPSKVRLDFLCVGFAKCGTTSLQAALSRHPQIYLPNEKETFFIKKVNEETHRRFKESYAPEKVKGRIAGGIEPTYFMEAEPVYEYFGPGLKLIMCVADPVRALYSRFKMAMRDVGDGEEEYLKRYGRVTPELFDEWAEGKMHLYRYMDYIRYYLHYFDRSRLQVIVSESLYARTRETMDRLQDFLGIEDGSRIDHDVFPHENRGYGVSRDHASACVNKKMWELISETKDVEIGSQLRAMRHEIFGITTQRYDEPMLEKTSQRLSHYYEESIHELEDFLDMSLEGIWYHK